MTDDEHVFLHEIWSNINMSNDLPTVAIAGCLRRPRSAHSSVFHFKAFRKLLQKDSTSVSATLAMMSQELHYAYIRRLMWLAVWRALQW